MVSVFYFVSSLLCAGSSLALGLAVASQGELVPVGGSFQVLFGSSVVFLLSHAVEALERLSPPPDGRAPKAQR